MKVTLACETKFAHGRWTRAVAEAIEAATAAQRDARKRRERRRLTSAWDAKTPEKSRALYIGSVPDAVELQELAYLFEQFGIIESLRLVRAKSCAFLNFCNEDVAAALYAKFKLTHDATPPEINGKHLTVNFAKARPCDEAQLARITDGARRTLRIVTPAHMDEDTLRSALGTGRAESIVHFESVPLAQGEGGAQAQRGQALAAESAAAEAADSAADAASTVGSSLAFVMSFSSVTAAISAKAALESLGGHPGPDGVVTVAVDAVSYVVTPVLSDNELAALIAAAEAAAAAGAAGDEATVSAEKVEMGEELAELVEAAAAASASAAAAAAVVAAAGEGSTGSKEASLTSAMDTASLGAEVSAAAAPPLLS